MPAGFARISEKALLRGPKSKKALLMTCVCVCVFMTKMIYLQMAPEITITTPNEVK